MCRRVSCAACGKPTYAGCGAHVEQVLATVPPAERCRCRVVAPSTAASKDSNSFLARLRRAFKA